MTDKVKKKVEDLIKRYNLNCSVEEFKDRIYWYYLTGSQKLSEDFIREFKNKVEWSYISAYQELSEKFIREFQDKVNWYNIFMYQKISKDFIIKFINKIDRTFWLRTDFLIFWEKFSDTQNTPIKELQYFIYSILNGSYYNKIEKVNNRFKYLDV